MHIEAASEQVMQEACSHLPQLGKDRLRLRNRLLYVVQYGRDVRLFTQRGNRNLKPIYVSQYQAAERASASENRKLAR